MNKLEAEVLKRFLDEAQYRKLVVVKEDGQRRHLRFRNPKSSAYWFDLVTWPGYLAITGDCGNYVFARSPDMFEFFRERDQSGELKINPSYWGEKLQAVDPSTKYKEFSFRKFRDAVKDDFEQYFGEGYTLKEKADVWDAIENEVLGCEDNEHAAHQAAYDFEHGDFALDNFNEHDLTEYTWHYLWCLYAIVWGIRQYDKETKRE